MENQNNSNSNENEIPQSPMSNSTETATNSPVINTRLVAEQHETNTVLEKTRLDMLMGVFLHLTVELGRTQLTVNEVLELQKGSVIELDRIAGEAVDIFVNNSLIARGDVVVVDDKFGVRITELISPEKKI